MDRLVLLDTHVLLWWVLEPRRLSRPAARALRGAQRLHVADITLREIAVLTSSGRVELDRDVGEWVRQAIDDFALEVVAISPAIAARSTRVAQNFHGDPADQLIAATAIELDVPLVTADEQLRASPAVRTIW
jgi:PIN domain nuclease of toxin-antitoxin system